MLISARRIQSFTAGLTYSDFSGNQLVQSAVIRELLVIGEAANHISGATRSGQPEIDWAQIIGMRNRMVHAYFAIDLEILWKVIQQDIGPLMRRLEDLLPPPN